MRKVFPFLIVLTFLIGCKQDEDVYGVNDLKAHSINAGKNKEKSDEQYVAVLHSDFYGQPVSVSDMNAVGHVFMSIGDKNLAHELLISNYMNSGSVHLPGDSVMRADIPKFVKDTYRKFLIREPTVAELSWFTTYIENHPNLTPELVYFSFASSNEYKFY